MRGLCRARDRGIPESSLVDPCANGCNLIARQPVALWRHLDLGIKTCNVAVDQAFHTFAWDNIFSVVATRQSAFGGIQSQAALLLLRAMARVALLCENGLDLAQEINLPGGRKF